MDQLPTELVQEIALNISCRDAYHLMQASKRYHEILDDAEYWRLRYQRDYVFRDQSELSGLTWTPQDLKIQDFKKALLEDPKKLYRAMSLPCRPFCRFATVWLNGQYWELRQDAENSPWGVSLHLNSVCWFEITGCFPPLDVGEYSLLLSGKMDQWSRSTFREVQVTVRPVSNPEKLLLQVPLLDLIQEGDEQHGYPVMESEKSFRLDRKDAIVIRFFTDSGHWKSGLTLDTLLIRRMHVPGSVADSTINLAPATRLSRLISGVKSAFGLNSPDHQQETGIVSSSSVGTNDASAFYERIMKEQASLIGHLSDCQQAAQHEIDNDRFDDQWENDSDDEDI